MTEHVASSDVSELGESKIGPAEIYTRDITWLASSDLLVADVSIPSLGVGFEIAKAIELKKRVLCIYLAEHKARLSAMISGCPGLVLSEYRSVDEAKQKIDNFFSHD